MTPQDRTGPGTITTALFALVVFSLVAFVIVVSVFGMAEGSIAPLWSFAETPP